MFSIYNFIDCYKNDSFTRKLNILSHRHVIKCAIRSSAVLKICIKRYVYFKNDIHLTLGLLRILIFNLSLLFCITFVRLCYCCNYILKVLFLTHMVICKQIVHLLMSRKFRMINGIHGNTLVQMHFQMSSEYDLIPRITYGK